MGWRAPVVLLVDKTNSHLRAPCCHGAATLGALSHECSHGYAIDLPGHALSSNITRKTSIKLPKEWPAVSGVRMGGERRQTGWRAKG